LIAPLTLRRGFSCLTPLPRRDIGFTSLHEKLDSTTPGGRLVFHVSAALAEFIRELIAIGTNEGLAAGRAARGVLLRVSAVLWNGQAR
jgi:DNA invertase Pin-like site-specific DNA recombinase